MSDLKTIIQEVKSNIYRNESPQKWAVGKENLDYISKKGLNLIGIGLLEKFRKSGKDKPFVFVDLFSNEKQKGKEFLESNPNKGEILCRYFSDTTRVIDMTPLCILNADKGYMRFMDNIEEDSDIEDAEWSKPYKFDHLRTTF